MSSRKDDLLTRGPYYQLKTVHELGASTSRHLLVVRRNLRTGNLPAAREALSKVRAGDITIYMEGGITSDIKQAAKDLLKRISAAKNELERAEKRTQREAERRAKRAAKA